MSLTRLPAVHIRGLVCLRRRPGTVEAVIRGRSSLLSGVVGFSRALCRREF
jgi:hypothetical protein